MFFLIIINKSTAAKMEIKVLCSIFSISTIETPLEIKLK